MSRRLVINIEVAITRSFVADTLFDDAQRYAAKYRWIEAEEKFEKAIKKDPFNSPYLSGFADFLFAKSRYTGKRKTLIAQAEALYAKAAKINPRNGEYSVRLGEAGIGLFLEDKDISDKDKKRQTISSVFTHFRAAVRKDPNGFNVAYSVGYSGLSLWEFINDEDKDFILDRLRYALKVNLYYSRHIYPKIWKYTRDFNLLTSVTPDNLRSNIVLYDFLSVNNLWQYRKAQAAIVEYYKRKERPEAVERERAEKKKMLEKIKRAARGASVSSIIAKSDWKGKASNGGNTYIDGNMFWSGIVYALIDVPEGEAKVNIEAKGSPAYGIYPYMIVELDGENIGEAFAGSPEWKEYTFKINSTGGIKVLSIAFVNDAMDDKSGDDRNLCVGTAEVKEG